MCKIFTLTNTSKIKKLTKVINTISDNLMDEKDGFGYAIAGTQGVFGERTTLPETFFSDFDSKIVQFPFASDFYNRFGTKSEPAGPGIFHGRICTNDKTLINTHPISKDNWHLIHNGVVNNNGPDYEMFTTNDTEHLLHYLKGPNGVSDIEKYISGYYAISAIDPTGKLHIIKDSTADLFVARIETIDSLVFATTPFLIMNVCDALKWERSSVTKVANNVHLVFNGNNLLQQNSINPLGLTVNETKHSEKSLGRIIDATIEEIDLYTPDQRAFLKEIHQIGDYDYNYLDYNNNPLTYEKFMRLDDGQKLYCTVIRPDGTIVNPEDYNCDKIYCG